MGRKSKIKKLNIPVIHHYRIQFAHFINYFLLSHKFKGSMIIKKYLTRLLIPSPKGPLICPTVYGFKMLIDPTIKSNLERMIYSSGTYEAGTINVMKNFLRKGDTFIDIGSHIGIISLAASQFVGKEGYVYSFEPEPDIFGIFRKNIKINNFKNIHAENIAIGKQKEKTFIYPHEGFRGATLIKLEHRKSKKKEVLIEKLDDLIYKNKIRDIKMVKIDVQGWELEVLEGARKLLKEQNAPIICIEYGEESPMKNGQSLDIYDYISSINNYKIFKLEKGKTYISNLIRIKNKEDLPYNNDNIFCFLPFHIKNLLFS